jgi:NADP-dependent 3-hydroxy acid dehydrogenase YdfG
VSEARTVLVTGASAGIGAAIARAFGKLGHAVALGARREPALATVAAEVEALGGRAFAQRLDVTDPASADAFVAAAESALGPIDTFVSNAGMAGLERLEDKSDDGIRAEIEVNVLGPLFVAKRLLRGMQERGCGDLIFVTSETAVRPRPHQVAYSAAKAGLEAAARAIGMEVEGTGVRSIIARVGPTGDTEFGHGYDPTLLHEALTAWKHWGVQRHLHWMTSEAVAEAIVRLATVRRGELVPAEIEIMPSGRFDPRNR